MSAPALLVLLTAVALLVRTLTRRGDPRPMDRWAWLVTASLVLWQLRYDGLLFSMVPVYFLVVTVLGSAIVRRMRTGRRSRTEAGVPGAGDAANRKGRTLARLTLGLLSLPLLLVPVIEATVVPLDIDDLRDETWVEAFDQLHTTLESRYAFGDWKRIDWDEIHARHAPAVTAAQQANDPVAYYRAIRAYLFELPDGHIGVDGPEREAARFAEIGGGFGFAMLRLDDGTAIAHVVEPGGPAAEAGMAWGARIIELHHSPTAAAAAATSTLWAGRPPATTQVASIVQYQLTTRAPVGTERTVTFQNPGATHTRTVVLTAEDDDYATLDASRHRVGLDDVTPVAARMLDDGIGYVRISSLNSPGNGPNPVEAFDRALQTVDDAGALILDTRGNRGGRDDYVPAIMSHFTPERLLYEHLAVRSPIGRGTIRLYSLHTEPRQQQYTGPVVVLVDHRTKSSGEGFALIAKQLPNATVIGLEGTDGSFGIVGGSVLLPTGIEVGYPWAQSIDDDGKVQIDGDHRRRGGIEPDIVVPLTFKAAKATHLHGQDVVLDHAIHWLRQPR